MWDKNWSGLGEHLILLLFLHLMILQNISGNLCRKSTFRLIGPPGEWLRNYWQVCGAGPIVAWYRANMTDFDSIYSQCWCIIWDICDFVNGADYRQIPLNDPSGGILGDGILLGEIKGLSSDPYLLPNGRDKDGCREYRSQILSSLELYSIGINYHLMIICTDLHSL